ncbi:MAG: hypothetical protein GEU87_01015 [Alphaproteobacteria bacterium]|nr:hypothetical protein [Alphaproteobacteria bacterium]
MTAKDKMPKAKNAPKSANGLTGSALTQRDADDFRAAAKRFSAAATTSPRKARSTLHQLGTHTKSGRLSKQYSK